MLSQPDRQYGSYGGGIYCDGFHSFPEITGCTISGNSAFVGGGISCGQGSYPRIVNCLIFDNSAEYGGGISSHKVYNHAPTIVHSIILENIAQNRGGGFSCDWDSSPTITNCIIFDNLAPVDPQIEGDCLSIVSYTDVQGGWPGEGNIDADPIFREGYFLSTDSPCIDVGTDAGVYTDIEGDVRPFGAGFDMGVDENTLVCVDDDGDGFDDAMCGGTDCDDADPAIHREAEEICDNGIDDDCDGMADADDQECPSFIYVPTDYSTIQAGIGATQDGDTILVAPGTYNEMIDFLGKDLKVRSDRDGDPDTEDTDPESTIIQGFQNGSVVTFTGYESEEAVIDGFTIRNGGEGPSGGIFCSAASLTIENCRIIENYGSGVYSTRYSSLMIENSTISGNSNHYDGGGIICTDHSSLMIRNCTISDNSIDSEYSDGGGVYCSYYSFMTLEDCTISGNIAESHGGGMYCGSDSSLTANSCIITGNIAHSSGGGIYGYSLTIANTLIFDNFASSAGGGISCYSTSTFTNCSIFGNRAVERGGGFYCSSYPTITNCTISGNIAQFGGGIYSHGSSTSTTNSILWGDSATEGPEIWIGSTLYPSTLTVRYSDIQGGETAVYVEEGCTLNWLEGNIDEDPLFLGESDFRLGPGSLCIDAGDPDTLYDDVCLPPSLGTERNDMGAFGGPGACGWCGDHDGDGYETMLCGGGDCDDSDPTFSPGVEELCDGMDNDCDGQIPAEESDGDEDGFMPCEGDCDDLDADRHPGALERCNGIDDDCDGSLSWYEADADSDDSMICEGDCDDSDPDTYPGAPDSCDGIDQDCDGADGVPEICDDTTDNDCDGLIDDLDHDCFPEFILEMDASFSSGTLSLNFTIGTPVEAFWANYLILTYPTFQIIHLWTVPLQVVDPPIDLALDFPLPSGLKTVGMFTGLFTEGGAYAFDLEWIHTGIDVQSNLPDTGIELCYDDTQEISCPVPGEPFYGQDAHYSTSPMSFTDNYDGTVTDNVAGLMWQQDDATENWYEAKLYCRDLELAGHTDWRLPDEYELQGIVDYGRYDPAVDPDFFKADSFFYWSSSTHSGSDIKAWGVGFYNGRISNANKLHPNYFMCVRGETTIQSFTDNGDGTVTENVTGLMWQKEDDDVKRNWEEALAYCEALDLSGHMDWRLPDIKELNSIVDKTGRPPAIDTTYFPGTDSHFYWSSSTVADNTESAWEVYFGSGAISSGYGKYRHFYVRCMR